MDIQSQSNIQSITQSNKKKESAKTQKRKINLSKSYKSHLWDVYDIDKKQVSNDGKMECLYENKSNTTEEGLCSICSLHIKNIRGRFSDVFK